MKFQTGHDRNSKTTASAADPVPYPEQPEVAEEAGTTASHDEIARYAHELWRQRGRPDGSADKDWFDAAEQLRARNNSRNAQAASRESGSVQH